MNSFETLLRSGDATIAYRRVSGSAPGIVFLAGLRSDMTGTKALYLDEYCRRQGRAYVRFDYFGHGSSSGDFADGTVGRWAEDAIAVIDRLTQGPQILVGSSLGGWLMLLAALARAERIHALVGIAAAPDATEDLLLPRLDAAQRRELFTSGSVTLPSEYDPAGYTYRLGLIEDGRRHLRHACADRARLPGAATARPARRLGAVADQPAPRRAADEPRRDRHPRQGRRPSPLDRTRPRPPRRRPR